MIAAIEQAMIDRLKAASKMKVLGYTLRTVESLPIDIDDRLKEHVNDFPAAWTVFGGYQPIREMSSGAHLVEATYHVVCAAQNLRSEGAARFGDGVEVGTYQMIQDVTGLLLGNTLGLDIQRLRLGPCRSLYSGTLQGELKVSLFAAAFLTQFTLNPAAEDILAAQPLGDFATFHVDWMPGSQSDVILPQALSEPV